MFLLVVTIASLIVATVMSVVAWQIAREERRRSRARIEKLAQEIEGAQQVPRIRAVAGSATTGTLRSVINPEIPAAGNLFQNAPPESGSRHAIRFAIGALIVASVIALVVVMSSGSPTAPLQPRQSGASLQGQASPSPIALVALGHERTATGLIVRGVVRNPQPAGSKVGPITAVVFLFNREGGFLGSGRATLEPPVLVPGGESTFSVGVPTTSEVERYRVSFRVGDQMVPHVDRRGSGGS
jgi:hypothetical protein